MIEFLRQPWPWYVSGALIGLVVPMLLFLANRQFGISSSFRHICAATLPGKAEYFKYDWKKETWNLVFAAGIVLGAFIAGTLLSNPDGVAISEATKTDLRKFGITDFSSYLPEQIFSWANFKTLSGFLFMTIGGFLVGFGTRYANGCTSGHSIMGMSLRNPGSLFATISFFIGGLLMTWVIYPLIFAK